MIQSTYIYFLAGFSWTYAVSWMFPYISPYSNLQKACETIVHSLDTMFLWNRTHVFKKKKKG